MKHKRLVGCVLAAALTMSATLTGCSLVSQNSENDMNQVIAEVNIAANLENDDLKTYASAMETVSITKRQLISYYLNVGYSYVQNGSSYSEVFNMLVDALVNNAVVSQYSIAYLLNEKAENDPSKTGSQIIAEYIALETTTAKYEYILEDGESNDYINRANYQLLSSLNDAIDSFEETLLDEEDETTGTGTRTTPTNVDTENEDFYPVDDDGNLNYNVYTGYDNYLLDQSGVYQDDALEGTTKSTRRKAYTNFIARLINNNLVNRDEDEISDIMLLPYITNEYETQLQYQITQKYYDIYEEKQEENLINGEQSYEYLDAVYEDLLASQRDSYDNDSSAFESAIGDMSDSSFVLYTPENNEDYVDNGVVQAGGTYGFVYNILLPFSTSQSARLTELQDEYSTTVDGSTAYTVDYYNARNQLLRNITTTDQRAAWFNGETNYSFDADGKIEYYNNGLSSSYLFFENNMLNNERYEQLDKYLGLYPYNGNVAYNEETGSYNLLPNTLDIDNMLAEFSAYVDYALGTTSLTFEKTNDYYTDLTDATLYSNAEEKEIDYSKFIYATGKVTGLDTVASKTLERGTSQYTALSAMNELQYAYTTDVGVLSNYLGYTVTLGDTTGYIKEFEYAAHQAIKDGVGSVIVCAGDYGWHIMYVTYTFPVGEQFEPDWDNIDVEGTFEYNFYEWIKSNDISDISSEQSSWIVQKYKANAVTQYTERYQDLLDMDNA